MNKDVVIAAYPNMRLVSVTDGLSADFFGVWIGSEYLAISYESEEDVWQMAANRIYSRMVKQLEK
jgi:hypothetical protein